MAVISIGGAIKFGLIPPMTGRGFTSNMKFSNMIDCSRGNEWEIVGNVENMKDDDTKKGQCDEGVSIDPGQSDHERNRVEEALRESGEILFRNVFENHAAVKLLIDPDTGDILDANKAAVTYYGWSKEQLRRMKIQDINTLPPDDVKREMEKARKSQRIYFEFRHRLANGEVRDVAVYSNNITATEGKAILHSIIHDITEHKKTEEEREKLIRELKEAIDKIKTLHGMLPICASCKKIRDDKGYWKQIEEYLRDHSEAEFSHSICPDCAKKLYPEFYQEE